ncbi:MAG TPA: AAC(3) family N-acetyltransferase [Thermoleophilia bacterium]|nr:AAC(3) family N-acetyltransferase [Thermoleophilia bacterium]
MSADGAGRSRLRADLELLGLRTGSTVLVHASMRRVRPDAGGAATVVAALLDVLGESGTLVVPTQTAWNSTTSPHFRAATEGMTGAQFAAYLSDLPAFDPRSSPSSGMGALAEYVRTLDGAVRSAHPQTSFAAAGRLAAELMARHDLDCLLGERSPLAALYRVDARVLLLGTGFDTATIFHLGEWRASTRRRRYRCKTATAPDATGWVEFEDLPYDDADFTRLGARFEQETGLVARGAVGSADALLFPARAAADFAQRWVRTGRGG